MQNHSNWWVFLRYCLSQPNFDIFIDARVNAKGQLSTLCTAGVHSAFFYKVSDGTEPGPIALFCNFLNFICIEKYEFSLDLFEILMKFFLMKKVECNH